MQEGAIMELLDIIQANNLADLFVMGNFGIEKEGLRATPQARLAKTLHPKSLLSPELINCIQTDYGEAMPELITPPLSPYTETHKFLANLSQTLINSLPSDEYMWPFSMPCNLPSDDEILISQSSDAEVMEYMEYTARKYGKSRQLVTGIHINFSLSGTFLSSLFAVQDKYKTVEDLRDNLYLKLTSNYLRYEWFMVYLFGASPVAADDFYNAPYFKDMSIPTQAMRSIRNSKYGFNNVAEIKVRYDSVEKYVSDLRSWVDRGYLRKEREYYANVRLKGKSKDTESLLENGIIYLEFRSFDNNPYHASGLTIESLEFIHLFLLTLLLLPTKASAEEIITADLLKETVAEEHPLARTVAYMEGKWLCTQMSHVAEKLKLAEDNQMLIKRALELLDKPELTISARILQDLNRYTFCELGEKLGQEHRHEQLIFVRDKF